ncbi:ABC transporter ATP-binding protein [Pseudohalocynthiibacter aestuariivivens]|nr:ABC transporter ATP-binding protein [Pseudohalocynthiibacter aestuariivivens]QIE44075.1 ABC transporter ATP-binding protein [Pseudohalocynthiibacter aestuariivivens]
MSGAAPIIEVNSLSVGFTGLSGRTLPVLHSVDLSVARGQSVGLVGESGSGKSTLALAAMGYLKSGLRVLAGTVQFDGHDMFAQRRRGLESIRGGQLGLVPQNAGQSLTPTMRIGRQMAEALRLHSPLPRSDHTARALELLTQVRLPDPETIYTRFPHELSGGQQQRVAIAMALAGDPDALLLDEPTTGLDVTTQAHLLDLLRDLAQARNMAMLYVSHDLGVIARTCDRVMVMYAGEVVLEGDARDVLRAPLHPYARGLLASIPRLGDTHLPVALEGRPPAPGEARTGCAFAPRCALARGDCRAAPVTMHDAGGGMHTRCLHHNEVAALPKDGAGATAVHVAQEGPVALSLEGMAICYAQPTLWDRLVGAEPPTSTVQGITTQIARGETLGLVGESGSGKSTILKAIAGLLAPLSGTIALDGDTALPPLVANRRPDHLRRVQLIFQNPDDSLNPRHTVAQLLAQPLTLYHGLAGTELRARQEALLEQVRLGAHYLSRLPGQLSGGEKQRVAIARAFAADPDIVLCDEVTSALDVSVQAAVLELLNDLKAARAATYVFVSHDLAVVRALADRVAVLYQGRLCEIGPAAAVYGRPSHPYTEVLLGAVLEPDPDAAPRLLANDAADLAPPATGCPFQRRCPRHMGDICNTVTPPARASADGHLIYCHLDKDTLDTAR